MQPSEAANGADHALAEPAVSAGPEAWALRRVAFALTMAFGASLFWVVSRLPMGDLPQHVAQVQMLRDLVTGTSRWSDLVRINLFTPYLLGYALATALSFALSPLVALKVVLTAAYLAFVPCAIALRKELGGDERLDWLFIPCFFGFAFLCGMYTFLVASPLGLLFLVLAKRFADAPRPRAGARLVGAGLFLLFCHGLLFALCAGIGGGMTLTRIRRDTAVRALAPYALLGLVLLGVFIRVRLREPLLAHGDAPVEWEWDKPWGWHRIYAFPGLAVGFDAHDPLVLTVAPMLAAPWLLGDRVSKVREALVPFAVIALLWLLAPGELARTNLFYHRFALYLLPAYAVAFVPGAFSSRRAAAVEGGLALLCWVVLGTIALRERRFERESAPFDTVMAAAEPGQRALEFIVDPRSAAVRYKWTYHAYALWYQVDRGGFVDFNFAGLLPQAVRYRSDRAPPFNGDVLEFDWHALDASMYRYFFVRHLTPLPAHLFDNDQCTVNLIKEAGDWSLFERGACGP
jgi:hypothetical protein